VIERDGSMCAVAVAAADAAARQRQAAHLDQQQNLFGGKSKPDPREPRRRGLAAAIGASAQPAASAQQPPLVDQTGRQSATIDKAGDHLLLHHIAEQVRKSTGYSLAVHTSATWQAGRGLWLEGSVQVSRSVGQSVSRSD
jgi:hypothetical protein